MQDEVTETSIISNGSTDDLSSVSFLDFRSKAGSRERADGLSKVEMPGKDEDFFQNPKNCASLMNWSSLNKIYPILGAYGGPTSIYPTKYCSVIGTAKGVIMIFSAKQLLLNTLVPRNKESNHNDYLRSPVVAIVVSADGTHLAASYQSGDVFIWNLNAVEGEMRNTGLKTLTDPLDAILHIAKHRGNVINGMGFVALRHTALIVSDNSGQIMYHNGYRSRLWALTYSSERIIEISSRNQLMNSKVAPYAENGGSLHLVAVLTSVDLAVVSTNPHLTTLFHEKLPPKVTRSPLTNSCLSWYRDSSRVAYSVNRRIGVFIFNDLPSFTLQSRLYWDADEPILSLQWVNERLLGILTISHQFLMVDVQNDFNSVIELDLLPHDLLIPLDKHFAIRDNELYLLTHYTFKIGKFVTWLDITLSRVQKGDYIGALTFFRSLLRPDLPIASLIKVARKQRKKEEQLRRPFYNLSLAALRFVLGQSTIDYNEVYSLFSMVLQIVGMFQDEDVRRGYTDSFLEQSLEFFGDEKSDILFEVLVNHIMEGSLTVLPPLIFKKMLKHYADIGRTAAVEELIVMLDPKMLDIDLAVKLCIEYGLFDALVYIWNEIFGDYITPLVDAICKISQLPQKCTLFANLEVKDMIKIFDYLSFTLTGRRYPRTTPITPLELQAQVKTNLYSVAFSGTCIEWPAGGSEKIRTKLEPSDEPAFPYFKLLLEYNPVRFLSTLNEAFEDPYFNESDPLLGSEQQTVPVNRQNIIHVMLDIIRSSPDDKSLQKALLAIFVAGNSAKYTQFIHLSNQDLEKVTDALCQYPQPELRKDLQMALESLFTAYTPYDTEKLIMRLKEKDFKRVLFTMYLKTKRYVDLFLLVVESRDTGTDFDEDIVPLVKLVLAKTRLDAIAHVSIINIIKDNFPWLVEKLGPERAALSFENYDSEIHNFVMTLHDQKSQREYLGTVSMLPSSQHLNLELKKLYIELTIENMSREKLIPWLDSINFKNVDAHLVLSLLLARKHFEGASVIHMRLQKYTAVVDDLLHCLREWFQLESQPYQILDSYLALAVDAANASHEDRQANWTNLLACLIEQYGNHKMNSEHRENCNKALQKLFVRLAISDAPSKGDNIGEFWTILTGVLEHQDVIMRRAQDLKELLLDIFKAYNIQEHISRMILKIVEDSSGGITRQYNDRLQNGHSIYNDECEACGKKIWGKGLNPDIFRVWEAEMRKMLNYNDVKGLSIIVFFCRHGFHKGCLDNLGQYEDAYFCLICNKQK